MLEELYFVSSNENKAREVEAIIGLPVKTVALELAEIQDSEIAKIVAQKALTAFAVLQKPVLVDDGGLYIGAWNGFPGPFIKFLLAAGGNELILKMLENFQNRAAVAKGSLGFASENGVKTFVGEVGGSISLTEKGKGWGWDPIFIPEGEDMTYAEMGTERKNRLSHRAAALKKFKAFIRAF